MYQYGILLEKSWWHLQLKSSVYSLLRKFCGRLTVNTFRQTLQKSY
jgi:hypothetical protein